MAKTERIDLIKNIQDIRGSKVICYLTGDRPGFETAIGKDIFPILYEHLLNIGDFDKIDLFLYSRGGDTLTAFGIVNHIREFCKEFSVLIPHFAHSAATLITLGANSIIMGKMAQLSPIDPSITTHFNPEFPRVSPQSQVQFLPVNVEEVVGFINLAKKEAKLEGENALESVFSALANRVHPLCLGAVYRSREQISMLAQKLLKLHNIDSPIAENIVRILSRELYSHDYIITRREAKSDLALPVLEENGDLEKIMWNLYKLYADELELHKPFNPESAFPSSQPGPVRKLFKRAFIESEKRTDYYKTEKEFLKFINPPGAPPGTELIQHRVINEGWDLES